MYKSNISKNLNKNIFEIALSLLIVVYFYKLYFEFSIPISGDELNSILVYSSNIKTLFLKNFPHNAVFFHAIGYIKSIFFGFELTSFRIITFFFVLLHFFIIKKLKYDELKISLFFILLLVSNFSLYAGIYVGYIFSSSIFTVIFYLILKNEKEKNNKLVFFLLFVQLYNHLVNIYLVLPILLGMFMIYDKKKFLYDSIIFFGIPIIIFYFFSIFLTGLSALKISDLSYLGVLNNLPNSFGNIFIKGFEGIFFYEGISGVQNFSLINTLRDLYFYDKFIFIMLNMSILTIFINLFRKKYILFSTILIFHFLLFIVIDKQPPPRIFTGFFCFYLLFSFTLIDNLNIKKNIKFFKFIFILLISLFVFKFNFSKFIENGVYANDIRYEENLLSVKILKKNCNLVNYNFSEMQKKNFYFNYLNICKKNFNLNEFLVYYRS
tara:strand:+ start:925 stop:2232 length:1308 start_codon:yes stop_codon:yes gene_type:complete